MFHKYWITLSNRHETIYKYFLVLVTVALIVAGMPRQAQFNYTFREGKPWTYANLMAPFDFAIHKSDDDLNRERAEALRKVNPYYVLNDDIAIRQISSFRNELREVFEKRKNDSSAKRNELENLPSRLSSLTFIGEQILNEVYDNGIIRNNAENQSLHNNINIIRNNVSEEKNIADFFSLQSAFAEIEQKLNGYPSEVRETLLPVIENALSPNLLYDDARTKQFIKQVIENISPNRGMVQNGEVIVLRGQVVDEPIINKLESLRTELRSQEYTGNTKGILMFGNFILVSIAISMLLLFLYRSRKEYYNDNSRIMLLMILILLITYLFLWARKIDLIDMYLVPVCILPIIVRAFYDSRTALFSHIIMLLVIGFEAPNGFEFIFVQSIAGMVATFSIVSMNRRSQFFITALLIFLSYSVSFLGISFLHEASFTAIDWTNLKWFAGNCLITLFAFPLIFIFEKSFGFLSDISLMELSDSNSPLLRELAFKAPGTFQHSLQVANLAEAAVFKIGGNPLLARAGAMYHDTGKMDMPVYFIENLTTQVNPHDELAFEESARIIKSHVIKGIEKARKHKIPEALIDFIRTHHGTSLIQYFYQSFLKNYPNEIPDEEKFHYSGPLPFSKETAVLMMADSVEASSRSLNQPDEKSIAELIDKIINSQIENQQFVNCPVTLKDISDIKLIFKKMLMSIYHVRIEYPD